MKASLRLVLLCLLLCVATGFLVVGESWGSVGVVEESPVLGAAGSSGESGLFAPGLIVPAMEVFDGEQGVAGAQLVRWDSRGGGGA